MRYILRKFVEAETVEEALQKEPKTPVHDAYLKEGEEPKGGGERCSAIGFALPPEDGLMPLEMSRKKR